MKYVIITGANGGIGKAVSDYLLKKNYSVIALDISKEERKEKENYKYFQVDITKDEDLKKVRDYLDKEKIEVFAIINLAGIFMLDSIIEGSEEKLRKIIEVNFFGMYKVNRAFFDYLVQNGRIINMASEVARHTPQPFMAYYTMSKKMVDTYSDVLRRECNYLGIKVIKLYSGSMKTGMLGNAKDEYERMIEETKYFIKPLTKLKGMMDKEVNKTNDPILVAKVIEKALTKRRPRLSYKIKNSLALSMMGSFNERFQDYIYKNVIN